MVRTREDVPYVFRSEPHYVLWQSFKNASPTRVLVRGGDAGYGVTRTLEEFAAELVQSNRQSRVVCIDFHSISYERTPVVLARLRNQLVEYANANGIANAHLPFKDFDRILFSWAHAWYITSQLPLGLSLSKAQMRYRALARQIPKSIVAVGTGGLVDLEMFNQLLEAAITESSGILSDKAVEKFSQKIAAYHDAALGNQAKRTIAFLARSNTTLAIERLVLEFFVLSVRGLYRLLAQKALPLITFDSIDSHESNDHLIRNVRGSIITVLQDLSSEQKDVVLGARGDPINWKREINPLSTDEAVVGEISRIELEQSWVMKSIDPTRLANVLGLIFSSGNSSVSAADLADAWARCEG